MDGELSETAVRVVTALYFAIGAISLCVNLLGLALLVVRRSRKRQVRRIAITAQVKARRDYRNPGGSQVCGLLVNFDLCFLFTPFFVPCISETGVFLSTDSLRSVGGGFCRGLLCGVLSWHDNFVSCFQINFIISIVQMLFLSLMSLFMATLVAQAFVRQQCLLPHTSSLYTEQRCRTGEQHFSSIDAVFSATCLLIKASALLVPASLSLYSVDQERLAYLIANVCYRVGTLKQNSLRTGRIWHGFRNAASGRGTTSLVSQQH